MTAGRFAVLSVSMTCSTEHISHKQLSALGVLKFCYFHICELRCIRPCLDLVRSFVRSLRPGVQPTLDPALRPFELVQFASPKRGGELIGSCGVSAM